MTREVAKDALISYVLVTYENDPRATDYGRTLYLRDIAVTHMSLLGPYTQYGVMTYAAADALVFLWPLSDSPEKRAERITEISKAARWKRAPLAAARARP